MNILDDELLDKIRQSSDCLATAEKYRSSLIIESVWNGVGSILLLIVNITYFIVLILPVLTGEFELNLYSIYTFGAWFFIIYYFFKILNTFKNAVLDLLNNKLDISQDVFLSLSLEKDQSYAIVLKDAGSLPIIRDRLKKFKKNTVVYVIRAAYSKNLLDLIPVNTI